MQGVCGGGFTMRYARVDLAHVHDAPPVSIPGVTTSNHNRALPPLSTQHLSVAVTAENKITWTHARSMTT
jgi:hypothetical protein